MIDVTSHDEIVELSLSRPPVNAITLELLETLSGSYSEAVAQGAKAIVLSGREGLFSAGLDVPALINKDRAEIETFWTFFFSLLNNFANSAIPITAAITGHAPAGGMVLALYTDYRIAAQGNYSLGLNEVSVGLQVPRNILMALEMAVGTRKAAWLATTGTLLTPDEALGCGLVDELTAPEQVISLSVERMQALLELPSIAMNKTRLAAKSVLLEKTAEVASFARIAADAWCSDESQQMLKQLVDKLQK